MDKEDLKYVNAGILGCSDSELNEELSQEVDSEGNPLTKEQVEFFKNSKVRDSQGRLLVCYHGTDATFTTFEKGDIGFHFGTKEQATFRLEKRNKKGNILTCYLNITNPMRVSDLQSFCPSDILLRLCNPKYLTLNGLTISEEEQERLALKYDIASKYTIGKKGSQFEKDKSEDLQEIIDSITCEWGMYTCMDSKEMTKDVQDIFRKNGYDGLVYDNEWEWGDGDYPEPSGVDSYVAFEPNQIKSIDNKTPSNSNNINEDLKDKTFTFPNLKQAIDYFWKDRDAKIETVPIKKLVYDNDLLNDDDLQSYHQRQWDNKKASEFSIDKSKATMWRVSEVPYAVRKKDGKLELGDGRHRTRALYNDGYEYVTLPVITESKLNENKTTPKIRESLLQEGKQDIENFKKWIENNEDSNARLMSDGNKEAFVNNWATEFNNIRQNLKSPYNDFYYWIKLNDWNAFTKFMLEQRNKKDAKQREKDGARLIYSDNDWKVYEITTYEASVKYGANTKWCISGSKRWSNGENGQGYWDDYTSKGVKFYFFIGKDTKYAIAIYPNGTDFEIFDAQDNSIAYIPNAPIIDEIKIDYYSQNEDRLMLNLIKTGQLPHVCMLLSQYLWEIGVAITIYDKSGFDNFLQEIRDNVNEDYVKWLAVYYGLKDEEWYENETGEEYEDEWLGDTTNYIYTYFLDNYATLDDALTKDNPSFAYDKCEYFISDLYDGDIDCCKDWVAVWLYIHNYMIDETDLINFVKEDIRDNLGYSDFEKVGLSKEYLLGENDLDESLEDFDDEVGKVYHGGIEKSLHKDFRSILWFTEDYDYALDFGENIFICNLNLKNTLIVGNTDGYIRGLIPTQFSTEFTRLANNLRVTPRELLKCNPEAKNIYSIVRTKAFKELCIKNGYDSVETEEFGHVCFGVFNLDQVDIVDTDFEDESTLETLSPMDEAFSYTDRTNVNNLTDLDRQYFDYIYSGQSKKAKEILNKLALDWGALSDGSTPLELYHGTPVRFTKFDATKGFNVDAIYFSNSQSVAAHWSARNEYGKGVGIRGFAIDEINDLVDSANRDPNKLLDILNNHLYYQIGVNVVYHDDKYGDNYRLETPVTSSPLGYKKTDEIYFSPAIPEYDIKYQEHNLVDELLYIIEDISHKAFYYNNTLSCYLKMKNPLVVDAKGSTYYEVEFEGKKTNTETISSIAKKRGYDGVIVKNVYETDLANIKCNDYIVFEPNQIKSCNLIVTDDDAEIIPPSKRFTTSDDIREELKEDIAYRGHNEAYGNTLTGDIGFHFGTEKSAKEREQSYRRSKQGKSSKDIQWVINKYNIKCDNLLELEDNGGFNWLLVIEQLSKLDEFKGDKGFAKIIKYVKANFKDEYKVGLDISKLGDYDYYNYFVEKYPKSLDYSSDIHTLLRNFLKKNGYNGIQYVNNTEDKGSISYCIFDENDVQLVDDETPTPNLRDIK